MKRMIDTGTWDDPWFAELEPDAKLVFLYLLTNRRSTAAGAFEITLRAMAFETGLSTQRIKAILTTLESRVQWWPEHQIVWVRKFFKHQAANDNFAKSAQGVIRELPVEVQRAIAAMYPSLVPDVAKFGTATGSDTHTDGYATGSDTPDAVIDIDIERDRDKGEGSGVDGADAPAPPKPTAKRAKQVPDDFTLSDNLIAWGTDSKQGFTVEQMESQVPRFVDYYRAKGEPRKDWDASFRTWMRNARDYGHLNRGSIAVHPGGKPNPNKRGGYTAGELMQLAEEERRRETA